MPVAQWVDGYEHKGLFTPRYGAVRNGTVHALPADVGTLYAADEAGPDDCAELGLVHTRSLASARNIAAHAGATHIRQAASASYVAGVIYGSFMATPVYRAAMTFVAYRCY